MNRWRAAFLSRINFPSANRPATAPSTFHPLTRCFLFTLSIVGSLPVAACHRAEKSTPPPDARRPEIRSREELAEQRQALIRSGRIVPTPTPRIEGLVADAPVKVPATPILPGPGAIQSDLLMVNDHAITAGELIYPIRFQIDQTRKTQTQRGFGEWLMVTLRAQVQREIGSILIFQEAMSKLDDRQKEAVDKFVERAFTDRVSREFGGRVARLDAHLAEFGLTINTYKNWLKRDAVVNQYSREKLLPLIFIRRDELLAEHRRAEAVARATPASRGFHLIEAPFASFLPEGTSWNLADEATKAQARLRAMRHIREAKEKLASTPFADVARDYCRGPHAEDGGFWGEIAMPLRPPYDKLSKLIFEHDPDWVSDPIENDNGWYIVHCGRASTVERKPFAEVQDKIRLQLRERRFNELLSDYVVKLANKATISSIDPFLAAAARRAIALPPIKETPLAEGKTEVADRRDAIVYPAAEKPRQDTTKAIANPASPARADATESPK